MKYILFFIIGFLFFNGRVSSEEIISLDNNTNILPVSTKILHYEDKENKVLPENVKDYNDKFQPISNQFPVFQPSSSSHWFKFTLNNLSDYHAILEIEYSNIGVINVYKQLNSELTLISTTGQKNPDSLSKQSMFFELDIMSPRATQPETFYLKINSHGAILTPFYISTRINIHAKNVIYISIFTAILGLLIGLAFYNFFLFLVIRDYQYLHYIFFLISSISLILLYMGLGRMFFPDLNSFIYDYSASLSTINTITICLFSRYFLETKKYDSISDKFILFVLFISFANILLDLIQLKTLSAKLLQPIGLLGVISIFFASIRVFIKGNKSARFHLFATFSYIIGLSLSVLSVAEILPNNYFTRNTATFAISIQTILLSFALADKINKLKKDKEEADRNLILQLEDAERVLEQKVQERTSELKKEKDDFHFLVTSLNDLILEVDSNLLIKNMWTTDKIIPWFSHEEVKEKTLNDLMPKEFVSNVDYYVQLALEKNNISIWEYSSPFHENINFFQAKFVPIQNVSDENKRVSIVISDITDRKLAEMELIKARIQAESADRAKTTFLATMSHEIRTPLNAVINFANLMQSTFLNDDQKRYTNLIKHSGHNLLQIITDILDISKIESGKLVISNEIFSIKEVSKRVIDLLSHMADAKGIKLKFMVDTEIPNYVIGDPERLTQILTNLINNAIKFTEKGSVTLSLTNIKTDDESINKICLEVLDTGIGMSEEGMKDLFKPFTQVHSGGSRKYGGTGLGLTISKQLTELMKGTINVVSKLGEGTSFMVIIPFKQIKQTESLHPNDPLEFFTSRNQNFNMENINILVAEDNEINILIITEILNTWNCKHEIVTTGSETLQKIKETKYTIILLDLYLPDKDGFEILTSIRNGECGEDVKNTPIIALSAEVHNEVRDKFIKLGASDFLGKPLNISDLYFKILKFTHETKLR